MAMEWDRYDDSPARDRDRDDEFDEERSGKHRSKDKKKGSSRGEEKEYHRSRDRDRDRDRERERRKDDRDDKDKERSKEKARDKHREKEREREKDRKDRGKERDKDRDRDLEKEKEREKHKDREEERDGDKDRHRDKGRERTREKEKERNGKYRDEDVSREKEAHGIEEIEGSRDYEDNNVHIDGRKHGGVAQFDEDGPNNAENSSGSAQPSASGLQERIARMKEERLKKRSEGDSEILSWVNKSRKLEDKKKAEKEKALQLSRIFEEQDNLAQEDSEDEDSVQRSAHNLAGVKVLHGLDKVAEGGAVVLTLKDQSILADGNVNEEVDMLENVEIGEQKQRDEAYKAAKKKTEIYDDKFNDVPGSERKILPQYDDPVGDEGVTLDERGRINSEVEKKLEELRRRLQGPSANKYIEDLTSASKSSSDYYTQEEMLKFKKPKKKKALRKREKLDLAALEAEALASGLGAEDLGSRNDGKRQAKREEEERAEAEKRINAYQAAFAKAEEASKSLHVEQTLPSKTEEDETPVIADDEDDLYKSLERARKLALKKQQEEAASGPQAIARLATSSLGTQTADEQNPSSGEGQDSVVFTEMEEFVWGLQLNEEARKADSEDVFMEEDDAPKETDQEMKDEAGVWTEVKDTSEDEYPVSEDKDEIVPDETLVEPAVGKGLSGALKLLKERGTLKETVEWGGRNMDKKKSKLVGIVGTNEKPEKEIRIERTDEFGRTLTPKEAFRLLSHKFHGKGPGKMKQEKRMKQYQEELKLKQMKNSDTPSLSVERMRDAQAKLKTPYLVLSGHVKPGQTSDPASGFATVEKDGGLTPMLGDKKVEHFLGIKRKAEPGNSGIPKKPKT